MSITTIPPVVAGPHYEFQLHILKIDFVVDDYVADGDDDSGYGGCGLVDLMLSGDEYCWMQAGKPLIPEDSTLRVAG